MREKKVGNPVCWIWTVTMGLTAKAVDRDEQSVLELMVPPLPLKYVTVEVPAMAEPPTEFCCTTAWAAWVAALLDPPQISFHEALSVSGSAVPVMPDTEMTRAAARAAASADRCASSRAR